MVYKQQTYDLLVIKPFHTGGSGRRPTKVKNDQMITLLCIISHMVVVGYLVVRQKFLPHHTATFVISWVVLLH